VALVRIGRYELEAISWLRAANEVFSAPGISWNLAIAYVHIGKVADAGRELQEFKKWMNAVPTARWLRHTAGFLAEGYAREVGGLSWRSYLTIVRRTRMRDCRSPKGCGRPT
jgi:hypothetical protein